MSDLVIEKATFTIICKKADSQVISKAYRGYRGAEGKKDK